VLTQEVIQQILEQEQVSYRQTIYTPIVTLWAWMSQVLDPDKSLSHTVARVIAWLSESGQLCRLRTLALIAKPVNDCP